MVSKSDTAEVVTLPRWAIGSAKWVIGGMLSAILGIAIAIIPGHLTAIAKVSRIPAVEKQVNEINAKVTDHHQDRNAHPDLGVVVTKIDSLNAKMDERAKVIDRSMEKRAADVDRKLDKLDEAMKRQWSAIRELPQVKE